MFLEHGISLPDAQMLEIVIEEIHRRGAGNLTSMFTDGNTSRRAIRLRNIGYGKGLSNKINSQERGWLKL